MPELILDCALSRIGKKTQNTLEGLRRQLPTGCDPCFDYAAARASQPSRSEKAADEDRARYPDAFCENPNWAVENAPAVLARQAGEETRFTSAFKNRGRSELQRLEEKAAQAPPPLYYKPKDECLASYGRVVQPPVKVSSFGERPQTLSRKPQLLEREAARLRANGQSTELLGVSWANLKRQTGIPENKLSKKKQAMFVDMSKQSARPDFIKAQNLQCNENTFTETLLDADTKCAKYGKFHRQPVHDFGKLTKRPEPRVPDLSEPGAYDPNYTLVKPRNVVGDVPFGSRPGHRALSDSNLASAHLPDRSLARDSAFQASYGSLVIKTPKVPDLAKYTKRPAPDGPETFFEVGQYQPKYDFVKPRKVLGDVPFHTRPGHKELYDTCLPGNDLPDRSLARDTSAPILASYGCVVVPPPKVPDLGKYTGRQ